MSKNENITPFSFSSLAMPSIRFDYPFLSADSSLYKGSIFSMLLPSAALPPIPMGIPSFNFTFPKLPLFNFSIPSTTSVSSIPTSNNNSADDSSKVSRTSAGTLNTKMVNKAKSYVGVVNSTAQGNQLFSPKGYQNTQWYKQHGRWGWCCDFAVYCAKDTLGSKYPKDMITSSPAGLVDNAKKHNAYLAAPSANKNSWLSNNVKPGDIIYMKGKGDSGKHIAVVESVDTNGNIKAISGNSGGKVRSVNYNINTSGIYGFINLNKLAA